MPAPVPDVLADDTNRSQEKDAAPTYWCSFCGKSPLDVEAIITAHSALDAGIIVNICDECIELCRDIIGAGRMKKNGGQ